MYIAEGLEEFVVFLLNWTKVGPGSLPQYVAAVNSYYREKGHARVDQSLWARAARGALRTRAPVVVAKPALLPSMGYDLVLRGRNWFVEPPEQQIDFLFLTLMLFLGWRSTAIAGLHTEDLSLE